MKPKLTFLTGENKRKVMEDFKCRLLGKAKERERKRLAKEKKEEESWIEKYKKKETKRLEAKQQRLKKLSFKVEVKHSIWVAEFTNGCYSDFDIKHFYFSANNQEEAWFRLRQFKGDLFEYEYRHSDIHGFYSEEFGLYQFDCRRKKPDLEDIGDYDNYWRVKIYPLKVIYFKV